MVGRIVDEERFVAEDTHRHQKWQRSIWNTTDYGVVRNFSTLSQES